MGYAEVCVNSPIAQRRTFSYAVPASLDVRPGQAVLVPFGNKTLQGVVFELTERPAVEVVRDITGILNERPALSPAHLSLARWLSEYYLSPLFDATALMLPPGSERRALTFFTAVEVPPGFDPATLPPEEQRVLQTVGKYSRLSLDAIEKMVGKRKAQTIMSRLLRKGLVARKFELQEERASPKLETYVSLAVSPEKALDEIDRLAEARANRQADLLEVIGCWAGPVPMTVLRDKFPNARTLVEALVKKGLITTAQVRVRRDPLALVHPSLSQPHDLTLSQANALQAIQASLASSGEGRTPPVFLLHGVTGSGKTEIYLQALAETVRLGKRGIVLVPEISLTPQVIERFTARFPGKVAILHSQLSLGERFDEWERIRNGEVDVVIGPRSALFAPQPQLGLIVLDEEHEWSYKQQETPPLYHAREVARKLGELTGAVVVLGSATPDMESQYRARQGVYRLLELPERVTPHYRAPLPTVEIVDMRNELKAGNSSMFSRALSRAIPHALDSRGQIILFLNRRGGATFIQCRNCGFVLRCRRCEVPLTYHLDDEELLCHLCNHRAKVPTACPQCSSTRIKFLGAGTQKLEQETARTFPQARLLRWDSDTTTSKHSHQELMERFRSHEADILIGTQLVARGLDLPGVTLVGVMNADTGLNLPDFRAGERTFQLLSQVAGRAGRGTGGGKAIIQTYSPEHYAVQAAARHDYSGFYSREIAYRRDLNNPPFTRLASLIYTHANDAACQHEAERMRDYLTHERDAKGIEGTSILGPAPAFAHRLRGRFRWQIVIRSPDPSSFLAPIEFSQGWQVDIDPVGL